LRFSVSAFGLPSLGSPGFRLNMHLRYDEDFVEAAVFLCTPAVAKAFHRCKSRFNREREKPTILDPDERNSAFRLHSNGSASGGLEKLDRPAAGFPRSAGALRILAPQVPWQE
jgi:hypothetical protein